MSSRNLLNLVLLAVVAILVILVVYEPGANKPGQQPSLTQLDKDAVTHILIKRETGEDITLVKKASKWYMLSPYALPANDFRMQSLLRILNTPSHSQHDMGSLSASKFGLEKPRATITFNNDLVIDFGNNEPLQHNRYLKVGNTLHLVTDTFFYLVSARATSFLDHNLLAGQHNIVKMKLPGFTIELKDGKWQTTPARDDLSADAITNLLNAWRNSQAVEIKAMTKQSSNEAVNIWLADQEQPVHFRLVKQANSALLQRDDLGVEYLVSNEQLSKLLTLSDTVDENTANTGTTN